MVVESHDAEVAAAQFRDGSPETIPVVLLALNPQRLLKHANAPFPLQIGSLPQHFAFEVICEAVLQAFAA